MRRLLWPTSVNVHIYSVGRPGLDPGTLGLKEGCIWSEWSGAVGIIRISKKTCPVVSDSSGGVGLVCGIFSGIFSMGIAWGLMSEARRHKSATLHWRLELTKTGSGVAECHDERR